MDGGITNRSSEIPKQRQWPGPILSDVNEGLKDILGGTNEIFSFGTFAS